MTKQNPKFYRHEALHTTSVVFELLENSLQEHFYYTSNINPQYNKHIEEAFKALCNAYQVCNKNYEVKKKI